MVESRGEHKVALVTGSASGIGLGIATMLMENGYDLIAHYNTSEGGVDTLRAVADKNGRSLRTLQSDFSEPSSLDSFLSDIEKEMERSGSLDALVHCAGVNEKMFYADLDLRTYDHVFSVNVKAPVFIIQKALPFLNKKAPNACVVTIGSSYGHIGGNMEGVLYTAGKNALTGLSRTIAKNTTIRSNVVVPGYIDAPSLYRKRTSVDIEKKVRAIPAGRLGTIGEVAALVQFILSDAGSYISGQTLHINGGLFFG